MIPVQDLDIFGHSLEILDGFGDETNIRGRFVALYLGLRRMGNQVARLGDDEFTPANAIERFLDDLFLKTHRPEPLNVLTALFGGSTSPNAPWSTRTGHVAPGNKYPTNTWRNNFNIQKGIGCPADADTIHLILANPELRLACPNMHVDGDGGLMCGVSGTSYRGDQHSIWMRSTRDGYQMADLDDDATFQGYLNPGGRRVPLFPLIGALYSFAQADVYPARDLVRLPEFARDFHFNEEAVERIFDVDPESPENAGLLRIVLEEEIPPLRPVAEPDPQPLPPEPGPQLLNTGVGAELAVAGNLRNHGWEVRYVANVPRLGYDLEARQGEQVLRVEVKSAINRCTPELTENEWLAAQDHGDEYVLAVVDYFRGDAQNISYVRNPAANLDPTAVPSMAYRFNRTEVGNIAVDTPFL